jgi:hypothetical protein
MADAASEERSLNEAHFEFRGAAEPPRANLRERAADRDSGKGRF